MTNHVYDEKNNENTYSSCNCQSPYSFDIKEDSSCSLTNREWLTTQEAADYLRVSPGVIRNLSSEGKIPYFKLGKRNRYHVKTLREFLFKQMKGDSYGN